MFKKALISQKYQILFGFFCSIFANLLNAVATLIKKFFLLQIPLYTVMFYSTFFSFIISLFLLKNIKSLKTNLKPLIYIGIFEALGTIFFFASLQLLHPAIFSILSRSFILFSIVFALLFLKEKFTQRQLFFGSLAIIGLFMAVYKDDIWGKGEILGIIYIMIFCSSHALAYALKNKYLSDFGERNLLIISNTAAFAIVCLFLLLTADYKLLLCNREECVWLFTSSLLYCISLIIIFYSQYYISFFHSSLTRVLNPLFIYLLSIPFFPLLLSRLNIFGSILCLIAITGLARNSITSRQTTSN